MNVSAVRRHLEALTKARLVEASFERIYLTGALLAKLGEGEAMKFMAETARSLAAGIRRGAGGRLLPAATRAAGLPAHDHEEAGPAIPYQPQLPRLKGCKGSIQTCSARPFMAHYFRR